MLKRLGSLTALFAVSAVIVTGCGSSSSSSSSSTSSSSAAAPASTSSATSTPTTSSASSGSVASNPTVVAAVARCKQSINAAPQLSADAKSKLDGLCDQAAKGDPAALQKASAQVCQQIIKDTVPANAQPAALASCPKG
jgi:hypothetical protein